MSFTPRCRGLRIVWRTCHTVSGLCIYSVYIRDTEGKERGKEMTGKREREEKISLSLYTVRTYGEKEGLWNDWKGLFAI